MHLVAVLPPYALLGSYAEPDAPSNQADTRCIEDKIEGGIDPVGYQCPVEFCHERQGKYLDVIVVEAALTWQFIYTQQFHNPLIGPHLRLVVRISFAEQMEEYANDQYDPIVVWSPSPSPILSGWKEHGAKEKQIKRLMK